MVHYTSCILVRPYSACFYACSPYNCIFTSLLSALKFCYETGNICFLETTFRFEDFKSLFGTNTIESRNNLPNQRQEIIYRNFKTASCLAVAFSAQIHKTLKFLIQNKNELKFKSCVIIRPGNALMFPTKLDLTKKLKTSEYWFTPPSGHFFVLKIPLFQDIVGWFDLKTATFDLQRA